MDVCVSVAVRAFAVVTGFCFSVVGTDCWLWVVATEFCLWVVNAVVVTTMGFRVLVAVIATTHNKCWLQNHTGNGSPHKIEGIFGVEKYSFTQTYYHVPVSHQIQRNY